MAEKCIEHGCRKNAVWIRRTQFSGSHPFCLEHATKEVDFKKDNSYCFWEEIKPCQNKRK